MGQRQLPPGRPRRPRSHRVARRAAVLQRTHRDVRRELRRPDELRRRGRAARAPARDRADAIAVVAVSRRRVPRRHQGNRTWRHRQLAGRREPHRARAQSTPTPSSRPTARTPRSTPSWRDRSFVDCLGAISIPVLAIGGWNDQYFRSGTLANIEARPDQTWAIYGPWQHFFPVALGEGTSRR